MQQVVPVTHDGRQWIVVRLAWARRFSLVAALLGLILFVSVLPVQELGDHTGRWIGGLGVGGPGVFVLIYVIATVLMIPGSALTLVAGAVFGFWIGLVSVSVGSTLGAAMALLIGRRLARDRVAGMLEAYPTYHAIDRAIERDGWKIVLLLRLSPVVPFNVQNYLYGLTSIRFWPAVLASWVGMLPGTFLYVYIGYAGKETVSLMRGEAPGGLGRTIMMATGLIATIAVSVYIARLAKRTIGAGQHDEAEASKETAMKNDTSLRDTHKGDRRAITWVLIGLAVLSAGLYDRLNPGEVHGALAALFGPPAVVMAEAYKDVPDDAVSFDHSAFDGLLKKHVDPDGWVDYKALAADPSQLDAYIATLADAPFDMLDRDEKLALLINAYNAFTLRLILDHFPVASIKDIPDAERWDAVRWGLAGKTYSLNQIEHEQVRPNFKEPRIHFALVCAAYSCPKLRNEAYTGDRLEAQLADQTAYTHTHDRWLRFNQANNTIHLTALYDWYGGDFKSVADSVLDYVARQVPAVRAALDAGQSPEIKWLDYDWKLNDRHNRS